MSSFRRCLVDSSRQMVRQPGSCVDRSAFLSFGAQRVLRSWLTSVSHGPRQMWLDDRCRWSRLDSHLAARNWCCWANMTPCEVVATRICPNLHKFNFSNFCLSVPLKSNRRLLLDVYSPASSSLTWPPVLILNRRSTDDQSYWIDQFNFDRIVRTLFVTHEFDCSQRSKQVLR